MNLKRSPGSRRNKGDEGFTFIEVIVSVTIISIISFSLWLGFNTSIRLLFVIPELSKKSNKILALNNIIQEGLERVIIPFWISEYDKVPEYELEEDRAVLPYFDGIMKRFLILEFIDNYFKINTYYLDDTDNLVQDLREPEPEPSPTPDPTPDTVTPNAPDDNAPPIPDPLPDDNDDVIPSPINYEAGPFHDLRLEKITTKEEGFIGLKLYIVPQEYDYDEEIIFFCRIGSAPFWKEE